MNPLCVCLLAGFAIEPFFASHSIPLWPHLHPPNASTTDPSLSLNHPGHPKMWSRHPPSLAHWLLCRGKSQKNRRIAVPRSVLSSSSMSWAEVRTSNQSQPNCLAHDHETDQITTWKSKGFHLTCGHFKHHPVLPRPFSSIFTKVPGVPSNF